MFRMLSNASSVASLKAEAKRWLRAIRDHDTQADTRLRRSHPNAAVAPTLRDIQHALALEHGFAGWMALCIDVEQGAAKRANARNADTSTLGINLSNVDGAVQAQHVSDAIVSRFLRLASRDPRIGGGREIETSRHTASRLLGQHPAIARSNIFTAVTCGDLPYVQELLNANPELAQSVDADRQWTPLLLLANARLLQNEAGENAMAIAGLLLDCGADANVYCPGGIELTGYDEGHVHFTAFTGVVGMGENRIRPHPQARDLVTLLLERGAEPYDQQVLYNVFAEHSSRFDLTDDIVWLLERMYRRSVRMGRVDDWKDSAWTMLDVGSYGPGAHFLLSAAASVNLLELVEWMLQHGAGPNTKNYNKNVSRSSLLDDAVRRENKPLIDLLVRYGADSTSVSEPSAYELFVGYCMQGNIARAGELLQDSPGWLRIPHALMMATRHDNATAVGSLLALGMSPDIDENSHHARALHAAAFAGATRAAKVLLDAGADPDFRESAYQATPMGVATWARQQGMTDLLAEYSRDLQNLVYAGKVGRVEQVLLQNPSLATTIYPDNETSLMRLPDDESVAVTLVQLLLANGADVHVSDVHGRTAADIAESRAMMRVVALLRQ